MAKRGGLWLFLVGLALVACTHPQPAEPVTPPLTTVAATPGASEQKKVNAPIFVGLEMRDHDLWLHMGADGPLYTVKGKDGRVLADQIDEERLKQEFPELQWNLDDMVDVVDEYSGLGYSDY